MELTPTAAIEESVWGGPIEVRTTHLSRTVPPRQPQLLLRANPNRVAWQVLYAGPGGGVSTLALAVVVGERGVPQGADAAVEWVLRANGDYIASDVREDAELTLQAVTGWLVPQYGTEGGGVQSITIREWVRIRTSKRETA